MIWNIWIEEEENEEIAAGDDKIYRENEIGSL